MFQSDSESVAVRNPEVQEVKSMEVDDCDDSFDIISLPPEILSYLFACLSSKNRKNMRLVCKSWYESASRRFITRNEKFVFQGSSNWREAVKFLHSNIFRPNLEFHGVGLHSENFTAHFWSTIGPKIESLTFHDCTCSDYNTLENIIIHCANLGSLTITNMVDEFIGKSNTLMDKLIDMGVKRPRLYALSLLINYEKHRPYDDKIMNKFFSIFPSIKYFRVGFSEWDLEAPEAVIDWRKRHSFETELMSISIDKFKFLTNLAINYGTDGSWIENLVKLKSNFKLIQFETTIFCPLSLEEILLNFFTAQTNLKIIKLKLLDSETDDEFVLKLLLHILENCTNLRNFSFDHDARIHFPTDVELAQFLILMRNLKFFDIVTNFHNKWSTPWFTNTFSLLPVVNFALTALSIEDSFTSQEIMKHSPLLKHLNLRNSCDGSLQIIFKYLSNLQTLILTGLNNCTNNGFRGQVSFQSNKGYSIGELQRLRYLELKTPSNDGEKLNVKSICDLQALNLEDLSLQVPNFGVPSGEELIKLASSIPELRSIKFILFDDGDYDENFAAAFQEKILEFCRHFKNLHDLNIKCGMSMFSALYDEKNVLELLEACPSLRYISDIQDDPLAISFNPFENDYEILCSHYLQNRPNYFKRSDF